MSVDFTEVRAERRRASGLQASIAASELLLFCRDLRGTVTDVVVAAAGRALAAHPGLGCTAEGNGIGVAVDADGDVLVPVVRNATDAPLPQVRAEVSRLVDAARAGRLSPADVGGAAVTICDAGVARAEPSTGCVLAIGRPTLGSPDLTLVLSVDERPGAGEEAGRLFATLVRLLQHPYRRLV